MQTAGEGPQCHPDNPAPRSDFWRSNKREKDLEWESARGRQRGEPCGRARCGCHAGCARPSTEVTARSHDLHDLALQSQPEAATGRRARDGAVLARPRQPAPSGRGRDREARSRQRGPRTPADRTRITAACRDGHADASTLHEPRAAASIIGASRPIQWSGAQGRTGTGRSATLRGHAGIPAR
jgi:hypothetical protein